MTIMTGLATSGATSFSTGGDPAAPGNLCPTHSVESTLNSAVAETTALEQTIYPDASPIAAPTGDANSVAANPDSWRIEVAARLERYRTRRKPRTPRYPSLLLPFDAPESWCRPATPGAAMGKDSPQTCLTGIGYAAGSGAAAELSFVEPRSASEQFHTPGPYRYAEQAPEQSKVIEFPRSAAIPVFHASELADPIFDRPRIVEAPEILPPPPALGGMLIEPAQQE